MILVTGASGLLGSFVVRELQQRGEAVRVLVRPAALARVATLAAEVCVGDLADGASVARALDGVDGVVHSACTFSEDPTVDLQAMAALGAGWRRGAFVHISSLDVYGLTAAQYIDESHPLDESFSGYGRGKVGCERLLREAAARQRRDDFTILRAPHLWGPHPRCYRREVERHLAGGRTILLPGATPAEWSRYGDAWIDTRDLAWIVAECLRRPYGGALNAIAGHFSWHDTRTELLRLTGARNRLVHKALADITDDELPYKWMYTQTWRYSNERLTRHLGFTPRYRWQETLADIVAIGRGEDDPSAHTS